MNLNKQDLKVLSVVGGGLGNVVLIMLFYYNWYLNQELTSIQIFLYNKELIFLLIPFTLLIIWGGDSENFKI